jgi:hypothetical protein
VSWAHFGFPEQQATSQTRPVNSQGVPLSGVVPAVCYSACVGCLWWIPTQKAAKTQFLVPWHPAVAATNNLMTNLYSANEMPGLRPGLRPQKVRWKTGRRTCREGNALVGMRGAHGGAWSPRRDAVPSGVRPPPPPPCALDRALLAQLVNGGGGLPPVRGARSAAGAERREGVLCANPAYRLVRTGLQATNEPHCSRDVQPGGVCACVVQRVP